MKRDWGNSARVKNVFAVQIEIFFALGKDNKRLVFYPKFRLLNRIAKIPPLPQRAALISSFTANGSLITQAFLFALAAYFFIG